MKKKLLTLLLISVLSVCALTSCSFTDGVKDGMNSTSTTEEN